MRIVRMRRALKITSVAAAIVIAAGASFSALFDWNLLRGRVARMASETTHRAVTIDGLAVRLGLRPIVRLDGVRVANPPWADKPDLVTADRVTLTVSLPALLRGTLVIDDLTLVKPRLGLEQRGAERSWEFTRDTSGEGTAPIVHRLQVVDGLVHYRDAQASTELDARIQTRGADASEVWVGVRGVWSGAAVSGEATGPALLPLFDIKPYPLKAQAAIGSTWLRIAGTVTGLAALQAVDLQIELAGDNLADIEALADVNVPDTPPYAIAAHLHRERDGWHADELRGTVGDSDVAGSAAFSTDGRRPLVRADLVSNVLDFDDLGPLIGAPPKTGLGEAASSRQRQQARAMARSRRVLPDAPFHVGRWDRFDADVRYVGKRVLRSPALPIDSVDARVRLESGALRIDPLTVGVAGGQVSGTIRLDSRARPPQSHTTLQFRNLRLAGLFPTIAALHGAKGLAHGRADITTAGNSVARMAAAADGRLTLAIERGTISNLVLELIGLDAGEALRIFVTGDREIPLNCAIVDLRLQQGVGTTEALVLDTTDTLVIGTGIANLRQETLDFTLYPRPKDKSVLAARGPLHVEGPLRDPVVRPDAGVLAARGAGAVLLGLVNPLLAVLPLIETGPGGDSHCAGLVKDARSWAAHPPRPHARP